MKTTPQETAAILAGLRLLQRAMDIEDEHGVPFPSSIYDVLTDGGTRLPLSRHEIEALCAKVNA